MITHITIIGKGRVGGAISGLFRSNEGSQHAATLPSIESIESIESISAREFVAGKQHITHIRSNVGSQHAATLRSIESIKSNESIPAPLFLLACKDAFLPAVLQRLAEQYGEHLAGSLVIHVNGSLGTDILEPVRACGAMVAAAHPFQTFGEADPKLLEGIGWGVECDDDAWRLTEAFVKLTGGCPYRLPKTDPISKRLYHAAAVAASNFTYAAYDLARELAKEAGIPVEEFLVPIMRQTLENAAHAMRYDAPFPLTGPLVRGDMDAVQRQLDAMPEHLREQYVHLTNALKEVIKRVPSTE